MRRSPMQRKPQIYILILIVLFLVLYLFRFAESPQPASEVFRATAGLTYSKHALCRMDCRGITTEEIQQVLSSGSLNRKKSGFDKKHNNQTYVVEGYGDARQHIRVVVTPRNGGLFVITVIDLGKDWQCDCR